MADYGWALGALKDGARVQRAGWNGKNMWLIWVNPGNVAISMMGVGSVAVTGKIIFPHLPSFSLLPWIGMKTADNKFVPWLCSQTDAAADDWGLAE